VIGPSQNVHYYLLAVYSSIRAFKAHRSPLPAFFYCSRNAAEPTRSNPATILASIVRQLSSLQPGHPLLEPVVTSYQRKEAEGFASGQLRIEESCELIIQLAEHYPLTTIIIDALDECDPETRTDLLETLERVLQESTHLVKIFISSRDDQDIVCRLQEYPSLEIASHKNRDDITAFVRAETNGLIQKRKLLKFSSSKEQLQKLIIDRVIEGADGM
jgi:hypothetical protein